jgi:hypothetical protein
VGLFRTNKKIFFSCSVLAAWRVTPNNDLFLKKNSTSDMKTMYVFSDIGSRIIHTPSCGKKSRKKCFKVFLKWCWMRKGVRCYPLLRYRLYVQILHARFIMKMTKVNTWNPF